MWRLFIRLGSKVEVNLKGMCLRKLHSRVKGSAELLLAAMRMATKSDFYY